MCFVKQVDKTGKDLRKHNLQWKKKKKTRQYSILNLAESLPGFEFKYTGMYLSTIRQPRGLRRKTINTD